MDGLGNKGRFTHVLGNFGAKVGTVDHARMFIRVGGVHGIAEEGKRRSCFDRRAENQTYDFFERDGTLADAAVMDTVEILFFPVFSPAVFQRISFLDQNFMGIKKIPVLVQVFLRNAPE